MPHIAGRSPEFKAPGAFILPAFAPLFPIRQGTFQVSENQIRAPEMRTDLLKQAFPVVGRQRGPLPGGAHHDVPHGRQGQRLAARREEDGLSEKEEAENDGYFRFPAIDASAFDAFIYVFNYPNWICS